MIGRHVEISGLAGRPDLNGKTGRVESQNPNTQRYNVPSTARASSSRSARPTARRRRCAAAAAAAPPRARRRRPAPRLRCPPAGAGPEPRGAPCALVLVLVVGFSALNAALVSGVLYLALSAVRREGGARGARAPWRSASPSSRCASA